MNDMPVFGPAKANTQTALEDIAIETGVPIEVLFASGERAGAQSPDDFLNAARQSAQALAPRFQAGEDPMAIIGELFGPEAQRSFGDYATDVRAALYGTPTVQEANVAEIEEGGFLGTVKRRGQQFIRGATEPFAALPEAKAIAQAQLDNQDTAAEDLEGFDRGQRLRDGVANTFGAPNPEDKSFWAMVAEGAGNLVGMGGASLAAGVAGTLTAGPVGGAVAGFGAGGALGSAMTSSQLYREALDAGANEDVAQKAANWGFAIGASEIVPIARAFKYLPQSVRGRIGNGVMKRFTDIAQSAGEEAAQEYLATVAQNMVAQQLYDPDRGWTEGATEGALVGAVLGGGAGAIGAGVDEYRNRRAQPGDLPNADAGGGAVPPGAEPAAGMVPPVMGDRSPPEQEEPTPMGGALADVDQSAPTPMTDATARAPQPAFGNYQAQQPVSVRLVDPETGEIGDPINATFVGEDPAAGYASFRAEDGTALEVDIAQINSGMVLVSPNVKTGTVPPNVPTQETAAPAFNAPIPEGVDPDVFVERVATRQADGMSEQDAYQMTLQETLNAMQQDVGVIADDVTERQRQEQENASRIDEAAFTDGNGQPVVFPTQAVAQNRLGAGYDVEPFGGGFIGVRKQGEEANAESTQVDVPDGLRSDGSTLPVGGADAAGAASDPQPTIQGGASAPDGQAVPAVEQDSADAPRDTDTDAALTQAEGGEVSELLGQARANIERKEKLTADLAKSGAPVRFIDASGQRAIAGPDMSKEGGFRLTRLGADGVPNGHSEFSSLGGAIRAALDENMEPEAATETAPADQNPVNKNDDPEQTVTGEGSETARTDQETDPKRKAVADADPTDKDSLTTQDGGVRDTQGTPATVDYPNRQLNMSKARADAPVNGIGDNSDMSLGNIALANAREGDVLPGVGTVLKVTAKQIQITKPDGNVMRLSDGSEKLTSLARDMGALIASSANLRDEQLGSLMDMIERDPALVYRDGVPMLFDDPAEQANRGQRGGRQRIGQPLAPPAKQDVDQAAADADPNPTDAQKEAGNYKKGHVVWNGMNLTIENAKGSERSGTDQDGETWSVTMPAHYGYFKMTEGADGEHVDFYMGEAPDADYVMWIDQADANTGKFDEHKIMVGFPSRGAALAAYRGAFNDGRADERIGGIFEGTVAQLKAWLESTSDTNFDSTKPVNGKLDFPFKKPADAKKTEAKATDKTDKNDAEGFSPLRDGYERVMVDGEPSTDQTRMTDDGFVVVRQINKTTIRGPQGQVIWSGAYDVNESMVDAEIGKARDRRAGEPLATTTRDMGKAGRYWDGLINGQQKALIAKTEGQPAMAGVKWSKIGDDAQVRLANAMPDSVFSEQQVVQTPDADTIDAAIEMARGSMPDGFTIKRDGLDLTLNGPDGKAVRRRKVATGTNDSDARKRESADQIMAEFLDAVQPRSTPVQPPSNPRPTPTAANFPLSDAEAGNPGAQARRWLEETSDDVLLEVSARQNGLSDNWLREERQRRKIGEFAEKKSAQKPTTPPKQSLSSLSKKDQDRAALLRARIADRLKNNMNSGVDPAILQDAIELTGLYIKDGFRKFRALLDQVAADMGMTPMEAEPWVRAGYTQARDNLDLDGENVSDMDDGAAVVAEVRKLRAEAANPAPQEPVEITPESDTLPQDGQESADEQLADQDRDQGELDGQIPEQGLDEEGQPERGPNDDERGEGDEDGTGANADDDAGGSLGDRPGSVSDAELDTRQGTAPPNFVITDDFALGEGTAGEKLAANMAALRLVRDLEAENRYATPEEQAVLAKWVGWGGLKTVFDSKHEGTTTQWGRAQAELKEILGTQEYISAMRSTNDAHYTSRTVVKAMWRAMRNFGFDGGRALEPTIGSGNFLGLQPADLSPKTEWFASELDPTTGRIAKHLYPQAQVFDGMGFQDAPFRRATFDVAIGNPPFGADMIGNKKQHPDLGKMKVHNFIIAKTGQLLREGGVMSMVVTHRFLDTPNPEARKSLAPDFNFLGAIRLPNTAFEENANTQVTTDIVFFQKRKEGEVQADQTWLETGAEGPNGTRLNRYFAENPDMILGRAAMDGTMYAGGRDPNGKGEFTVHADGRDLDASLNEAVDKIKATIPTREEALEAATTAQENSSTLPPGKLMLDKAGRIYRGDVSPDGERIVQEVTAESFWKDNAEAQGRLVQSLRDVIKAKSDKTPLADRLDMEQEARNAAQDAGLIDLAGDPLPQKAKYDQAMADAIMNIVVADKPSKASKDALNTYAGFVDRKRLGEDGFKRLSGILDLRQKTRELIALERADGDAKTIEATRRKLRDAYRQFKKAHGYLNASKNEAVMRGDVGSEFALELGYKAANKEGRKETAKEAPILERRVIYPHKLPDSVASVADGLHVSMQERGYVDPTLIADLMGRTTEDVVAEMTSGTEPQAFQNPKTGRFEIAEVYLSGNLAEKISDAENAGAYGNIPHLKNAMPPPKTQDQITPSVRSLWIPPSVFEDFLRAMGYSSPKVSIMENVGMASISVGGASTLTEFGQQFQTDRITAAEVFEHSMKGKIPVIYDSSRNPDGSTSRVKNEAATREAVTMYERIGKEFPEWAYANPERAGTITDAFNKKMNVVTERKYEGVRYLRMVGNSPEIDLRDSQKNGAWRMVQDKVTLLHHVVGAGKTFTAIAGIMERKRMGLTRKAVVAVPNHLTGQWGREWLELYPAANILVPTEKDFAPANRSKLINRIATGDFDAVIIGHSQLTKIENDPETAQQYINEQIEELQKALNEARDSGESRRTVGQIGTRLTKLRDKLATLNEKLAEKADTSIMRWSDLGVDYLTVDEAHLFKNLEYTTTASQLVGMNPPGGSQRAFDMLIKVRSLQAMQGGGVSFLTGTPVSNSLVEIYSMMKYLIPESLKSMGIGSFDSWKAAFIQDESRFEYTASMQLKERNIMSGMINLGPLSQLYRSFTDIVMRPDVERMFTDQMEARNAKEKDPAKHVATRFPTPKIKGGARQISLAPPTPCMTEFVRYLVMRMAGIKANKSDKEYMSVDNALWVLTDARKASVDIRTIDPTLGREEGSKVERASNEVFRIWEENKERRGTQLVFSDMSAPTKNAEKDANRVLKLAYGKIGLTKDALKDRIAADAKKSYAERWGGVIEDIENMLSSPDTSESKVDSLNQFIDSEEAQDASAAMFTADNGFSFYDDMKAVLIEKGVPENEIAFIHDYNTTIRKAQLFEAVNEGQIRVLIGSTQKMGAGTNAQKRMVALHHIDAPWRPSDMEQREGRIIRQGNMFYDADPEGFEVEITAYSTEQTADVVQWQVLERKAASIETFMNAAADSIVEEGGDADQYAEFMAQSTGKEVFLQKMQAEKDRDTEQAKIASTLRGLSEAKRFVQSYDATQAFYGTRAELFGGFSQDMMGEGAESYLSDWNGKVAAYRAEKQRLEGMADEVRARNADKPRKEWEKLPEMPPAPVRWEQRPENGWEAKVYDALNKAQNGGVGSEVSIPLPDGFRISITAKIKQGGTTEFAPYLLPPNNDNLHAEIRLIDGWSIEAKDFRRSDKLLHALSPGNIAMRAEASSESYANRKNRHAETLPQMRKIIADGVDRSRVKDAEDRLQRLTALARIEEVKFASESASAGENYFAARDDKGRDLIADDEAQPLIGQFQFKNAGQTYSSEFGAPNGTQRIEGTDRTGRIAIFEAENMDSGEAVVIEAIEIKAEGDDGPAEWSVLNVWDNGPDFSGWSDEQMQNLSDFFDAVLPNEATPKAKSVEEMRLDDDGGANFRASMSKRSDRQSRPVESPAQAKRDLDRIADEIGREIGRTTGQKVSFHLSEAAYNFGKGYEALDGFFLDGVIGVSAASPEGPIGVARHEVIHALRSRDLFGGEAGAFSKEEWRTLVRAARKNNRLRDEVDRLYDGKSESIKIEEVVAEMYREWSDGRDAGLSDAEKSAFQTLKRVLDAIINVLRGNGMQTAADVFERVRSGEVGGRGPDGGGQVFEGDPVANPELMASISKMWGGKPTSRTDASLDKKEASFVSNLITNAMASNDKMNTLGLVPGEVLFRDLGKALPSAAKWVSRMRKMTAERQEMHAESDKLAQEWLGVYVKDKENGRKLHDLMHEATIAGVDPSIRFVAPKRRADMSQKDYRTVVENAKVAYGDLKQKHDVLPQNMKAIFGKARDAYRKFDDDLMNAMVDSVAKAMDLQASRLKASYEAELQQIKDDGLEGDARDFARKKARSRYNQDVKMLEFSRNARIRKMRLTYESNRIDGPYFPLMRFGQFFVAARDKKGKLVHFERATTVGVQQRIEADMKAEGFTVETGVIKPEDNMSRFVDPNFVADVQDLLGEVGDNGEVLDAIYQRYLETLPSFSIRKANIHRKGVPGFDKDAIKAFSNKMFHGAHQLARLRHSMDLTRHIEDARREAKDAPNPTRAGAIANEMQKRHEWSLNPQGASWSAWATSTSFVWYLGLTPGAAVVNLTQTTVVGIPILAAGIKGGSVAKAAKALSGALADFTAGLAKGDAEWSRGALTSGRLSDDERKALQAAYNSGALDKSQAHDIAAIGDSGVQYSAVREKAMRPIAFLFHHAERLNREVTFLAAYRMSKESGLDPEQATVQAGNLTWDTHFNYENWSRPRFMQGDMARVAFVFRQFQVNMLYRLFRDTHQALKGESEEVRKQARAQLIGMTGSMMLHAGITGTWGYALMMLLAGMFFDGGKDEAEEELKNAVVSMFGAGAGGMILKGVPGHLTGTDLTSRIGMPELWFRSPNRQMEGKEAYNYWIEQLLGAFPAIGASIFRGASMVGDGEVWRGMELMVPKAVRDQMRFMRYLNEGVTTYKGDPLMDNVSAHDALKQAIGFSPARVSERYEQNRRMMNMQMGVQDERRRILSDVTRYLREGKAISPRAWRKVREFNEKYPTYAITGATIDRSLNSRLRASQQMEGGLRLNPRLEGPIRSSMAPSLYD